MQVDNAKKVVFITPYVWTSGRNKGMPTVFQTFQGFLEQGYEVHVIIATNQSHNDHVDEGIHYHYVRISPVLTKSEYDENVAVFGAIHSRFALLRHIKFRLIWLWFVVIATVRAIRLVRDLQNVIVVYAMTHFGTIPAYMASKFAEVVFVQRLFGSHAFLNWQKDDGNIPFWVFFARFDELLAIRIPSDLLVLGNDGTSADKQAIRLGACPDRVRHWLNGIDRSKFTTGDLTQEKARERLNLPLELRRIVFIGRLDGWKRADRLLRAIPIVKKQFSNLCVDIVGDGNQLMSLQNLSIELGIQDDVYFHGFVLHDQVGLFLAAADVYVSLQDYTNLGNNTIEALVSGKPVVVYDVGTIAEVVRNRVDGIVLKDASPQSVANALLELLSDENLCRQLGATAQKRSESVFQSWSERIELEIEHIESIYPDKFNVEHTKIADSEVN